MEDYKPLQKPDPFLLCNSPAKDSTLSPHQFHRALGACLIYSGMALPMVRKTSLRVSAPVTPQIKLFDKYEAVCASLFIKKIGVQKQKEVVDCKTSLINC